MKIFSTSAVGRIDTLTAIYELISSVDLMERASHRLTCALVDYFPNTRDFVIFAGPGNNGGDGLVMARLLFERGYNVGVFMVDTAAKLSFCCQKAMERLRKETSVAVRNIGECALPSDAVVVDALFGSGLNRPLTGAAADAVRLINSLSLPVAAVDIPSGLMGEDNSAVDKECIVRADVTFTLQFPKLSMLFADNEPFVGEMQVLEIGLSHQAMDEVGHLAYITEEYEAAALVRPRRCHSHKGDYGRALLVAGSRGMAGASVLAAKGALRSGVGLLTVHAPQCNNAILQTAVPEAMTSIDCCDTHFSVAPFMERYSAVGVGPGIGLSTMTSGALLQLIDKCNVPMVVDADALNILSLHPDWFKRLPEGSVVTPHPGEFARMAGGPASGYDTLQKALAFARDNNVCVVLKGAYTLVVSPSGEYSFNGSGNPGMATGGSGDILTGVILALLARGYNAYDAARLGVYVHGAAGDCAADALGETAMCAGDIVEYLPQAWRMLEKY